MDSLDIFANDLNNLTRIRSSNDRNLLGNQNMKNYPSMSRDNNNNNNMGLQFKMNSPKRDIEETYSHYKPYAPPTSIPHFQNVEKRNPNHNQRFNPEINNEFYD